MFDILTTAAISDELTSKLTGSRIQKTGLRDASTLVLEVYANRQRTYLVSVSGGSHPCCYLSSEPVGTDAELVTPFALMLRKHLRGGLITSVWHPPQDRIIRLSIVKRSGRLNDDDQVGESEIVETQLYLEVMGRRSNAILVDSDDSIMDSIKRVGPDMSRVRPILPTWRYELPPMPNKSAPADVTSAFVAHLQLEADPNSRVADDLVKNVMGLSPQMARESVFRATGASDSRWESLDKTQLSEVARETANVAELVASESWEPVTYADDSARIRTYAAVPFRSLRHVYEETQVDSISEAVINFVSQADDTTSRHEGRKQRLQVRVDNALQDAGKRVSQLQEQQNSLEDADRYRRWGDAIYASLWHIEPGQLSLEYEGETISLDPSKSANENAQHYFNRYRKSGRGLEDVESRLSKAKKEVRYLDEFSTMVSLAVTYDEIESLRSEWERRYMNREREGDGRKHSSVRTKSVAPVVDTDAIRIYVGRSSQQNDTVTFTIGDANDLWFHARGVPGSHVILKTDGIQEELPPEATEMAAGLAAYYSKYGESGTVEVDICERRHVRKIKGGGPGLVSYRNESTIAVSPKSPEDVEQILVKTQ